MAENTVYKVGISLALGSNHEQVLGALSRALLGVTPTIKQLEGNFAKIGLAVGGAFAMITGGLILRGLEDIIRKTADRGKSCERLCEIWMPVSAR